MAVGEWPSVFDDAKMTTTMLDRLTHHCELCLELNGIEHRRTRVKTPRTNGFVEHFNGTVLEEFFRVKMRKTFYETAEVLQADLDAWLAHYNTERPPLGYRNQGRRPIETINQFMRQEG